MITSTFIEQLAAGHAADAKETLSKRIDEILGKEKFTDDEINIFKEDLFAKLDVDNIREIKSTDLKLPRIPTTVKYLLQDSSKYNETKITEGIYGINIHKAGQDSTWVENWSEGCQVFKRVKDFDAFMKICKKARKIHGNSFTYTLLQSTDIK